MTAPEAHEDMDDMLPDEREIIAERLGLLEDPGEQRSFEAVADRFDYDPEAEIDWDDWNKEE